MDGFRFEFVTPLDDTGGDASILAPDGTEAGLVWEAHVDAAVTQGAPSDPASRTWGVWVVRQPGPMRNEDDARGFLAPALPTLHAGWRTAVEERRAARRRWRSARQRRR